MMWVCFLRGINVGGNNILPMTDLRGILGKLGFKNARTYIQSGNCLFESDIADAEVISDKISNAIKKKFSFRPKIMMLEAKALQDALANNPFPQAVDEPKYLHFFFMTEEPETIDEEALMAIQKPGELFAYKNKVFYLYASEGIGRSKIGAKVEKVLGVPMTARNLRTVTKLVDMA